VLFWELSWCNGLRLPGAENVLGAPLDGELAGC
jgi:hypothetical protein